jgi:PEP-CTERM motif
VKTFCAPILFFATLLCASPALAYLGGFEPADGYTISTIPQGSNPVSQYIDVTYYNAGQNGTNAGGGAIATIAPDSGLWKLLTQPGAFFRNSATRSSYTGGAPPYGAYPTVASGDGVPAYIIGNHNPGYLSPSALALRNETPQVGPPIGGPMEYDYTLDTYDFGGPAPASITSGVVTTSFRFCPNPSDPIGAPPRDKFIMSFKDSGGNIGMQIGYAGDNSIYFRAGSSGPWTIPGITANASNWDQFSVSIDLGADTFGISYHQIAPNITTMIAPSGTPLGTSMADLTHLGWRLTDQVLGGTGGKNFFDNFQFGVPNVPEPATCFLMSVGLVGILMRRRRPATA